MSSVPQLDTEIAWCQQARALLKRKRAIRGVSQRSMSKSLDSVKRKLSELKPLVPSDAFDEQEARFHPIANRLREIFLSSDTAKAKSTAVKAEAKKLAALDKALSAVIDKAKAVAADKARYDEELSRIKRELGVFKVHPKASPVGLEQMVRRAEDQAKTLDYKSAMKTLGGFDRELKKQRAVAERLRDAMLAQLANKPPYEGQLSEAQKLLLELKKIPGIGQDVAAFEAKIQEARDNARAGDYTRALQILEGAVPDKAALESKSLSLLETLTASNADFQAVNTAALGALQIYERIAQDSGYKSELANYQSLVGRIAAPGTSPENQVDGIRGLQELVDRVKQAAAGLAKAKKALEDNLQQMPRLLEDLKAASGPEVWAVHQSQADRLATALDNGLYLESLASSARLVADCEALMGELRDARADWEASATERETLLGTCDEIIANCPPGIAEARALKSSLNHLERIATVDPKDPRQALSDLVGLTRSVAALRDGVYTGYMALASLREEADQTIQALLDQCHDAVETMAVRIDELRAQDGVPRDDDTEGWLPFADLLTQQRSSWDDLKRSAASERELEVDGTKAGIEALIERISKAMSDRALKALASGQVLDEQRKRFAAAWNGLEDALEALSVVDYDEADMIREKASHVRENAEDDYERAITDIGRLTREATEARGTSQTLAEDFLRVVEEKRLRAVKAISDLEKKVRGSSRFEFFRDQTFAEFFVEMRAELKDLEKLGTSANFQTLQDGSDLLSDMLGRIRTMSEAMDDDTNTSFNDILDKIKQCEDLLGKDKDLKKLRADSVAAYNEELKRLKKTLGSLEPSKSVGLIQELFSRIEATQAKAVEARETLDEFDRVRKNVEDTLKTLASKSLYRKAKDARLAELVTMAGEEDKEQPALDLLERLQQDLADDTADPDRLETLETEEQVKAIKAAQAQTLWESALDRFQKIDLVRAEDAVTQAHGDQDLIKEIKRMVKAAKSMAKSSDFEKAQHQLALAREQVRLAIRNPNGMTIGSRNQLPKDLKVYRDAAARLRTALEAFPDAVTALGDGQMGIDDSAEATIRELLSRLTLTFDQRAFDSLIGVLSAKSTTARARRSAREDALALVRRYDTLLKQGPLMQKLVDNPIEAKEVPAGMSGMYYALNRLDGNVRRAVK